MSSDEGKGEIKTLAYTVRKLKETNMSSNSYTVGRHLELEEDYAAARSFETRAEAEKYVIDCQLALVPSELGLLLFDCGRGELPELREKMRREFSLEFCFYNERYLRHRRYFIDTIPYKALEAAFEANGVKVLPRRLNISGST